MIIEFVLLIWCMAVTILLGTVIHCQNNQSDILKILNKDVYNLKQSIKPPHINGKCCPNFKRKLEGKE